ncbi:MAG: hypothetical protein U0736_28960, partial [Gemmataceae bacterium]
VGGPQLRACLLRARLFAERGDAAAAQREHAAAGRLQPGGEQDWVARAQAQMSDAPDQALADLDAALARYPQSVTALLARATILEEQKHQPEAALAVLNALLEVYPTNVSVLCRRGLLLARLGRRDEAHRDGHAALALDASAIVLYRVGVIHLLVAPVDVHDRNEAVRLIQSALRKGYPRERTEQDPDLDAIRKDLWIRPAAIRPASAPSASP